MRSEAVWCGSMQSNAVYADHMVMLLSWIFREQIWPDLKPRWLKFLCFSLPPLSRISFRSQPQCPSSGKPELLGQIWSANQSRFATLRIHLRIHRDIGICESKISLRLRISSPLNNCKFLSSIGGWSLLLELILGNLIIYSIFNSRFFSIFARKMIFFGNLIFLGVSNLDFSPQHDFNTLPIFSNFPQNDFNTLPDFCLLVCANSCESLSRPISVKRNRLH